MRGGSLVLRRFASTAANIGVRLQGVGNPSRVLSLGPVDVRSPGDGEVVVRLEASSIHPADVDLARGLLRSTASGAGSEGTGVVEAVGTAVRNVAVGDRVVALGLGIGTWATRAVFSENNLFALSKKSAGSVLEQASLSPIIAALQMLDQYTSHLQAGDVLLHATSPGAVGMAVSQIAAARGLKVVSVIRNEPKVDEAVATLKEHGSLIAVQSDYVRTAAFRSLLSDLPIPKVALNGLGGKVAADVARLLAQDARLVTYSGRALQLPASLVVERGVSVHGFNLQRHMTTISRHAAQALVSQAENLVADGKVKFLIERHPLSKFNGALMRHMEFARERKIVLDHTK